ncbi:hypothetical protein XM38_049370 [Halomicronema hongdechloris C2206]|uniref:Uncharacterized protein n=1 Tax=Halomicronema hongdechloris C2206 TaxID=1641165 RepID=A0A1Z3HUJ7_9CYAN|nr:hypothetical protein XM38_049370 [Halomicronema hongdechloris C2206]
MPWSCVYNIEDFSGSSDQERFNLARDIAYTRGGGVIFLPAGTYIFEEDLVLKEGIVIRGASPILQDAKNDSYSPRTKLIFPQYQPVQSGTGTPNKTAFKTIRTTNPDIDRNIGLINLDINRAAVTFGNNIDESQNSNIVIYGIRQNNVATPNPYVPNLEFQSPWLRFSDLLSANIKVTAKSNVLIANNRLNDNITDSFEQDNYQIQRKNGSVEVLAEGWKVPFNYTNHYGISVNRFKNGSILFEPLATPEKEKGLFRKRIIIRNNWVYHTMSVGIHASGDGLVIKDNIVLDKADKRWYTDRWGLGPPYLNDSDRIPPNITYENRAIDWSGWNVIIEGNTYQVYRHFLSNTSNQSIDGEGILIQECCGGTKVKGVSIKQNVGNSYIGLYKIPDIMNVMILGNQLLSNITDTELIYVNADTNQKPGQMHGVQINQNILNGSILIKASLGGNHNIVSNNVSKGDNAINFSSDVKLENNINFEIINLK